MKMKAPAAAAAAAVLSLGGAAAFSPRAAHDAKRPAAAHARTTSSGRFVAQADDALFVDATDTHSAVSSYYGRTLSTSDDLKTNACCTAGSPPEHIQRCIRNIHPEVVKKYYGCGLCVPDLLEGATVLDLGCGAGRDVYIASQLVGPEGRVIGVDMTEEQLDVAEEYRPYHADKFGYDNVEFHLGKIEELDKIESLADGSVDVIISNCVINLCPDKGAVLRSCRRLLRPGGELYFSDVYSSRRVPESLRRDEVLWGECLGGALYWNDFHNLARTCGFADPRLVEDAPIEVRSGEVRAKIDAAAMAGLDFYSATYRLFNVDGLEPACEDYGQAVIYKGTIPRHPSGWALDDHHYMERGRAFPVCGNTWSMLEKTRFRDHFEFVGDFSTHYGIFEGCGTSIPYSSGADGVGTKGGGGGGGGGGGACC